MPEPDYSAAVRVATLHAGRRWRAADGSLDFRRDLVQEALVELWRKAGSYDPCRASLSTFSDRVTVGRIRTVIRRERRACRLVAAQLDTVRDHRAPGDHVDLRLDVRRVLRTVSAFDRTVAASLSEYSPSETSKRLGTARSTVYEAIRRLREAFSRAGLRPYRKQRLQDGLRARRDR